MNSGKARNAVIVRRGEKMVMRDTINRLEKRLQNFIKNNAESSAPPVSQDII